MNKYLVLLVPFLGIAFLILIGHGVQWLVEREHSETIEPIDTVWETSTDTVISEWNTMTTVREWDTTDGGNLKLMSYEAAHEGKTYEVFSIMANGNVELGYGIEPNEASKAFWDAVRSMGACGCGETKEDSND